MHVPILVSIISDEDKDIKEDETTMIMLTKSDESYEDKDIEEDKTMIMLRKSDEF